MVSEVDISPAYEPFGDLDSILHSFLSNNWIGDLFSFSGLGTDFIRTFIKSFLNGGFLPTTSSTSFIWDPAVSTGKIRTEIYFVATS